MNFIGKSIVILTATLWQLNAYKHVDLVKLFNVVSRSESRAKA